MKTTRQRIYDLFPIGSPVLATLNRHTFAACVTEHRPDTDGTPLFTVIDQEGDAFDCTVFQLETDGES